MSTTDRIAAIRARLTAATPGPWDGEYHQWDYDIASHVTLWVGGYDADGFDRNEDETVPTAADVALFENAPADLAYLLDELAEAQSLVSELRATIDRLGNQVEDLTAQLEGGDR